MATKESCKSMYVCVCMYARVFVCVCVCVSVTIEERDHRFVGANGHYWVGAKTITGLVL